MDAWNQADEQRSQVECSATYALFLVQSSEPVVHWRIFVPFSQVTGKR